MHKANALLTSLFFLENLSAQPAPPPPGGQLFDHRFPPLFAEMPPLSRLESAEDSLSQLDLTPDQKKVRLSSSMRPIDKVSLRLAIGSG
jgi:hypothetical protein